MIALRSAHIPQDRMLASKERERKGLWGHVLLWTVWRHQTRLTIVNPLPWQVCAGRVLAFTAAGAGPTAPVRSISYQICCICFPRFVSSGKLRFVSYTTERPQKLHSSPFTARDHGNGPEILLGRGLKMDWACRRTSARAGAASCSLGSAWSLTVW